MEQRSLGRSGLLVSVVGLGCNNFGGRIDFEATKKVVQTLHRDLNRPAVLSAGKLLVQPRPAGEGFRDEKRGGPRGVRFVIPVGLEALLMSPDAGVNLRTRQRLTLRIEDHDHMRSQWELFENGKLKTTEDVRYTRVQNR